MPLSVGHVWTYDVHGRRLSQVVQMRVNRRVAVSDVNGYELVGPLGTARLAWRGPKLVAETLSGTTYDPPIPLLDARLPQAPLSWRGTVTAPAAVSSAGATLTHVLTDWTFASRKMAAVETILKLQAGRRRIELDSWFIDGVGLVQQEERSGDVEPVRITMTGGP